MGERSVMIRLQGNSWGRECPWLPQAIHERRWIVRSRESMEETPVRFQNLLGCRPALRNKIGGHDAAFGCVPGLKRLRHGTEIFPQPAGLAGSQAQGILNFGLIKTKH